MRSGCGRGHAAQTATDQLKCMPVCMPMCMPICMPICICRSAERRGTPACACACHVHAYQPISACEGRRGSWRRGWRRVTGRESTACGCSPCHLRCRQVGCRLPWRSGPARGEKIGPFDAMSCIHDSRKDHGLGESIHGCVAGMLCVVVDSQVGSSMRAPSDSRGPQWAWAVALSPWRMWEGHTRAHRSSRAGQTLISAVRAARHLPRRELERATPLCVACGADGKSISRCSSTPCMPVGVSVAMKPVAHMLASSAGKD